MGQRALRRALGATVVASALIAASLGTSSPAAADEELPLVGMSEPIVVTSAGELEIPQMPGLPSVPAQCMSIPGLPGGLCVGAPGSKDPIPIYGIEDLSPLFKQHKAQAALGWIVAEGEQWVRAIYDVPLDYRVERYARSELRAYVHERLLDILDRVVYGVTLTADEQRAFDFLYEEARADALALSAAAAAEFADFENDRCTYRPPAAPAGVTSPVLLPKKVQDYCRRLASSLMSQFEILPPVPSVDEFKAWGAYRTASKNGLDKLTSSAYQDATRNMIASMSLLGGGIAAGFAAGGLAAWAGTSLAFASTAAVMMGTSALSAPTFSAVVAGIGAVAPMAAAAVAAVAVVGIVMTAISIWLVVENQSVGATLNREHKEAKEGADPLAIEDAYDTYHGRPLRNGLDPKNPPAYRTAKFSQRLISMILDWTTVNDQGTAVADPKSLWADSATAADDYRFVVEDGVGGPRAVTQLTVPQTGGSAKVGFSDGWMVVDPEGSEPAKPALSFGFLGTDGELRLAMRAPATVGGFLVSEAGGGVLSGKRTSSLTFKDPATGRTTTVRLVRPSNWVAVGPRPTATGTFLAGASTRLHPNPVDANGSIDLTAARTAYTYTWSVTRRSTTTTAWDPVFSATGYAPTFVPSTPGEYEARVTMTPLLGGPPQYGAVRFSVAAPPIDVGVLEVIDNGSGQARVDLQVTEPTTNDQIQVKVDWPPELGAAPTSTTLTLPCLQTGPAECTTARTGPAMTLVRALTTRTDVREPITVTVTNRHGTSLTRTLHLNAASRPTFAAPPAGANAGEAGIVSVGKGSSIVEVPLESQPRNVDYLAARLVSGSGAGSGQPFRIVDPASGTTVTTRLLLDDGSMWAQVAQVDGEWGLRVGGVPRAQNLGYHEFPILIEQTGGGRALTTLGLRIVASGEERYRGGLMSDVDPDNFGVDKPPLLAPVVLGGRTDWSAYTGTLCVSLKLAGPSPAIPQVCRPTAAWFDAAGKPKPFPYPELYPSGMPAGTYEARAWLATGGQHVDTSPLGTSFLLTKPATYPRPVVVAGTPTVVGSAVMGGVLTARPGAWGPAPVALRYRWLRDGRPTSATGPTYRLAAADVGRRISVQVTGSRAEWTSTTRSSTPVRIAPGRLVRKPRPAIVGKAKVGKTLTARSGRWDTGVRLRYRWYAGGKAIKGATKAKLRLTKARAGKRITVAVTAAKPGYTTVTVRSKATAKVKRR